MKAAQTAAFQNLSTLCIQSFLRNLNHRRKPKRRLRSRTIGGARHVRKIDYPGSNNRTEFTFDCFGNRSKIVEVVSGSTTSTKQFLGVSGAVLEQRDGSGAVVSQYFSLGQITSSVSYFYATSGGSGSIIGVSNNSGAQVATIKYEPFGKMVVLAGTFVPDFGFTGLYFHDRSGLNLTHFRVYSPGLARWISRDPLAENGTGNLYRYGRNNPLRFIDPTGLKDEECCYDSQELAEDTAALHEDFEKAIHTYNTDKGNIWILAYAGLGQENTRTGNILDRIFKDIVRADSRLNRNGIRATNLFEAGADVKSKCPDIFWEVTTAEQWPRHKSRFARQGTPWKSGRTPDPFLWYRAEIPIILY